MSIELTQQEIIDLGEGVRRIMQDKEVQKVWSGLEELTFRRWKDARDPQYRETLWAMAAALGSLRQALQAAVDAGQSEAIKKHGRPD